MCCLTYNMSRALHHEKYTFQKAGLSQGTENIFRCDGLILTSREVKETSESEREEKWKKLVKTT